MEELRGFGLAEMIHPDDRERVLKAWRQAVSQGTPYEVESRRRESNGEHRWFLTRGLPLRDAEGRIVRWYGTNTDIEDRKRAEEELRASEERFRQMADSIQEIFWMLNAATKQVIYVSPAYEQICGRSCASLYEAPLSYREVIHPDDRALVLSRLDEAERTGKFNEEFRIVRPDGGIRWVWNRGFAVRDAQGNIYRLAGVAQDITERKRTEESLRTSEARWRAIFENSAVGIALADLEGKFLATNHAYQQMIGYSDGELQAMSFLDLTHQDDRQRNWALLQELHRGTKPHFQIEKRYRHKTGKLIWVRTSVSPVPGSETVPRFNVAIVEDITERKQAEEELQKERAHLDELFEQAPEAITLLNIEDRVVRVNKEFTRLFGYSQEEALGHSINELIAPDDLKAEAQEYTNRLSHGQRVEGDTIRRSKDGTRVRVSVLGVPITISGGQVAEYVIYRDITDRKRAEEALRQLSGRLMYSQDEERRRISRDLHDSTVQTLAALKMSLGVIKRSTQKLSRAAARALNESLRLAEECAQEIRTLSHLLHPPLLDEFGLAFALRGYISGFRKRSGLRVKAQIDSALDQSRLPRDLETALFRIVQEGLTNIKHHSGSKSAVIELKQTNGQVVLQVQDLGHGIGPRVMRAIEKGDSSSLGVGIAGMRERVRQLGGEFKVETAESGTTLTAVLPIHGTSEPFSMSGRTGARGVP